MRSSNSSSRRRRKKRRRRKRRSNSTSIIYECINSNIRVCSVRFMLKRFLASFLPSPAFRAGSCHAGFRGVFGAVRFNGLCGSRTVRFPEPGSRFFGRFGASLL